MADIPILQTHLFLPCDAQVNDADDLFWFHKNMCHVIAGKFSAKPHVHTDAIYGHNMGDTLQS